MDERKPQTEDANESCQTLQQHTILLFKDFFILKSKVGYVNQKAVGNKLRILKLRLVGKFIRE